jgi:hypothetical protein
MQHLKIFLPFTILILINAYPTIGLSTQSNLVRRYLCRVNIPYLICRDEAYEGVPDDHEPLLPGPQLVQLRQSVHSGRGVQIPVQQRI